MKTYIIGRSQFADIVLADTSVARRHAELVITDQGRHHLTDCASGAGTWRMVRNAETDTDMWTDIRQTFIDPDEPLRLGDYACTVRDLLRQAEGETDGAGSADGGGRWRAGLQGGPERERLRGRVERDPVTGEIVRKRL